MRAASVSIAKALIRYLLPVGIIAGVVISGVALQRFSVEWRLINLPLHSTMETLGGLSALAMALVLLLPRVDAARSSAYLVLALGFFGMGLIEIFHAMAPPGHAFVWLRVLASLVGGLGFALVWWPNAWRIALGERPLLLMSAGGIVAIGIGSWVMSDSVPNLAQGGEFTPMAIALKNLACGLFSVGAVRFLWNYAKRERPEDFLFACLALLFAAAEYMFSYSSLWDSQWWFWHLLRLLAYGLVLGYIGRGYLRMVSDLRIALTETKNAQAALCLSESQLRQNLDERERLTRDLHDCAAKSPLPSAKLPFVACRILSVSPGSNS